MKLQELWLSSDEEKWLTALEEYSKLIKSANLEIEEELSTLNSKIDEFRNISAENFYRFLYNKYFVWKYTAPNRLKTTRKYLKEYENSYEKLKEIKNELFSSKINNIETGLKIAWEIKGLGIAGASGLLSLFYPEKYGTVDQFVVKSLLKLDEYKNDIIMNSMKPEGLKLKDAVYLIRIYQTKSNELNRNFNTQTWTPRKVDMILWSVER